MPMTRIQSAAWRSDYCIGLMVRTSMYPTITITITITKAITITITVGNQTITFFIFNGFAWRKSVVDQLYKILLKLIIRFHQSKETFSDQFNLHKIL